MNPFREVGRFAFAPVRRIIKLYLDGIDEKDLHINDLRFKKAFDIACKYVDERSDWKENQKVFCKKFGLLVCSKISRDNAYFDTALNILKEISEKKIF